MATPLNIAVIGMGGFAGEHHTALLTLEEQGECRLLCTCDPQMERFTDRWEALRFDKRGVRLFHDYRDMLEAFGDALDVVTIPTPVPLHAPMHKACCNRGIPVYLEKPPTLNYRELHAMMRAEAQARKLTNVGFNYIIEPPRQALKARIAAGEFGAVQSVRVLAQWPRGSKYYNRANWAGRLLLDGKLVLDSCMGNAMAHLVHNALFWAGTDAPEAWGQVTAVEAELYRAHPIQGTDTIFVTAETAQGAPVRIAMSHACTEHAEYEQVVCEQATITTRMAWSPELGGYRPFTIQWTDGREETLQLDHFHHLTENLRAYLRYVRGEASRPVTRLIDSQPFVYFNDLAYLAAGTIGTVPETHLDLTQQSEDAGKLVAIHGLREIAERFVVEGAFPSAQGVAWAAPGGRAVPRDLPRLKTVVEGMANPV